MLKGYEHGLTNDVIADTYSFLRSYGSYLISLGHFELQEGLHEIQKDNLKKGYFYYKDKINPATLINITRMALGINKVQWAKEFVESHRYRIASESELEEIYKLNLALCLFEENKYEEALLHVLYSFYSNAYFLVARRLELRIYFELDSDLLPYKIDSFRKYIERTGSKKSSDFDWEANNNFVKILLQIFQSPPKDAKRSALIIQRIQKKKFVGERKWLLEKAHKLA
ncbi:MAG: hypothetical protein IPH31_20380 [Lewinellaceae bacterium]|nr:hypothetical protein [Lewinellaceae bacterium]